MSSIHFDVFAGISGDMCLGALVDVGCPLEILTQTLSQLEIPGFSLQAERVQRASLSGTKIDVTVEEEQHVHRKLKDVLEIVDRISWPGRVREQIEEVFTALASAEAKVHNRSIEEIHFHEVGSYDAIIDISGTLLALHNLGIEKVTCSKIHVGEGFSGKTRHGHLPLPVPAAAELLQGFTLFTRGVPMEMVTPTGAALIHTLARQSSSLPEMNIQRVGYGAGTRDLKEISNLLRVFLGESPGQATQTISVIETNIDDMNPEHFDPLLQRLLQKGAVDVFITPVMMKKNRPGHLITVLTPPEHNETISQILLQDTTSIGVRSYTCERKVLQRETCDVETPWGRVKGKVCWGWGVEKRFTPEYESCRAIHERTGIPMARLYFEAQSAYQKLKTG